ncbi:hypothetical protein BESB_049180 [Besnoitia besnoiti]|uniref:Glycosyltransferase family protein n=1 Tax=Besnoitia besnoiti TaxID=94643 RepID=A0A2A9ML37_BESBE|nr:hypothetical protein BESB_049180 [Besnoitia besnoiti]PFH36726.1 hypothetical protein BESB_049180 [Besnoitia besnoiti]
MAARIVPASVAHRPARAAAGDLEASAEEEAGGVAGVERLSPRRFLAFLAVCIVVALTLHVMVLSALVNRVLGTSPLPEISVFHAAHELDEALGLAPASSLHSLFAHSASAGSWRSRQGKEGDDVEGEEAVGDMAGVLPARIPSLREVAEMLFPPLSTQTFAFLSSPRLLFLLTSSEREMTSAFEAAQRETEGEAEGGAEEAVGPASGGTGMRTQAEGDAADSPFRCISLLPVSQTSPEVSLSAPVAPPSLSPSAAAAPMMKRDPRWPYRHPQYLPEDLTRAPGAEAVSSHLLASPFFANTFLQRKATRDERENGDVRGRSLRLYMQQLRDARLAALEKIKAPWLLERATGDPMGFVSVRLSSWRRSLQTGAVIPLAGVYIHPASPKPPTPERPALPGDPSRAPNAGAAEELDGKKEARETKASADPGAEEWNGDALPRALLKEQLCSTYDPHYGVRVLGLLSAFADPVALEATESAPAESAREIAEKPPDRSGGEASPLQAKLRSAWGENAATPCSPSLSLYSGCSRLKVYPFSLAHLHGPPGAAEDGGRLASPSSPFDPPALASEPDGTPSDSASQTEEAEETRRPDAAAETQTREAGRGLVYHAFWGSSNALPGRALWTLDSLFAAMPRVTVRLHVLLPAPAKEIKALRVALKSFQGAAGEAEAETQAAAASHREGAEEGSGPADEAPRKREWIGLVRHWLRRKREESKEQESRRARALHLSQLQLFWRQGFDLQYIQHIDLRAYFQDTPLARHDLEKLELNMWATVSEYFGFFRRARASALIDLLKTAALFKEGGTLIDLDVVSLQQASHLPSQVFFCENSPAQQTAAAAAGTEAQAAPQGTAEEGHADLPFCSVSDAFVKSVNPRSSFLKRVLERQSELLDRWGTDEALRLAFGGLGPRVFSRVFREEFYGDAREGVREKVRFSQFAPPPSFWPRCASRRRPREERTGEEDGRSPEDSERPPSGGLATHEEPADDKTSAGRNDTPDREPSQCTTSEERIWVYGPSSFAPLSGGRAGVSPSAHDAAFWVNEKLDEGAALFNQVVRDSNVMAWVTHTKAIAETRGDLGDLLRENPHSFMGMMQATYCRLYCGPEMLHLFAGKAIQQGVLEGLLSKLVTFVLWLRGSQPVGGDT